MKLTSIGITVAGSVRSGNEDNFYINGEYKRDLTQDRYAIKNDRPADYQTFAVCDGMGGYSFGELASLKAVQTLELFDTAELQDRLEEYVSEANQAICKDVSHNPNVRIGATLALMSVAGGHAAFCNVGDSRIYLMRNHELRQISVDHTMAQSKINAGILDAAKARNTKDSQILTQHLGIREDEFILCPAVTRDFEIRSGDHYLLCSDGLTSMVNDEGIKETIEKEKDSPMEEIVIALVKEALAHGGKDNITVVLVKAE